ncbi:hypothetical protein [Streptomyces sp. TR06-5]|uniref:hypothetical protein n=1 Tax=unclassified Streptomyces TaxID=2593676 RepID=UPI0039A04F1C
MTYPPQPGQDPNNPYAQPQGQPGYGYPQQQGYGYPQQQGGLPQYGGPAEGYPMGGGYGMPMAMPGGVKAARVLLYVQGGLGLLGSILILVFAAMLGGSGSDSGSSAVEADLYSSVGAGVLALFAVFSLVLAVFGIVLATKFANGGNGVRIGAIVYGSIVIALGLFTLPGGILSLVLGVLVVVFVAKSDGNAWFNRPRY